MLVRSKMKLVKITVNEYNREFKFTAVSDDGTPENQRFNKATPNAKFVITVNNPAVDYEVGKYYYFDSTPVSV